MELTVGLKALVINQQHIHKMGVVKGGREKERDEGMDEWGSQKNERWVKRKTLSKINQA